MPKTDAPHIILITADELRMDSLSCYGQRAIQTPHVDSLASAGTQFSNAYTVSPLSLPSRCAILTGLYPHNSRAYSNFRPCPLNPSLPNIYNQLRAQGYSTAHFGKCHYTPAPYDKTKPDVTLDLENIKDFLMSLGMDHLDLQNGKSNSIWFWNDYSREMEAAGHLAAYRAEHWRKATNQRIFPFTGPDEWHPDAWTGRKAAEYIQSHDGSKPRFMWVSFSGPHYAFEAPESYYKRVDTSKLAPLVFREGEFDQVKIQSFAYNGGGQKMSLAEGKNCAPDFACKNYSDEYWLRLRRAYLANVALIDDQVGRIISAARSAYGDNVMIIFTTDHGEMLGNHKLWGKNGCAYEDVLKVPLLVQFPRQNAPAASDARVLLTDLMPTCLSVAGVEPPAGLDGRDIRQSMADGGHRYVFSECEGMAVISDGRFKYTQWQSNGREVCEAYDLAKDPHEFDNIVDDPAHAGEVSRLRKELSAIFMRDFLR